MCNGFCFGKNVWLPIRVQWERRVQIVEITNSISLFILPIWLSEDTWGKKYAQTELGQPAGKPSPKNKNNKKESPAPAVTTLVRLQGVTYNICIWQIWTNLPNILHLMIWKYIYHCTRILYQFKPKYTQILTRFSPGLYNPLHLKVYVSCFN